MPCQFKREAKKLGYLDQVDTVLKQKNSKTPMGKNTDTIQANQKIDLPLWLAVALARRELIELRSPAYMTKKYFDQLKAGSEVVSMR